MKLNVKQSNSWQKLFRKPFSYEERVTLQFLLLEKYSQKACALYLERSQSVISREVHRINGRYDFKKASKHALIKSKKDGRKRIYNYDIDTQISKYLYQFSPTSIILKTILTHIKMSIQTVYNWIRWKWLSFDYYYLLRPRKRKKTSSNVMGRSILTRFEFINNRNDFGHWEIDLIASG